MSRKKIDGNGKRNGETRAVGNKESKVKKAASEIPGTAQDEAEKS
jgi:hypothetical protein